MRISDWSSDVCSSDLKIQRGSVELFEHLVAGAPPSQEALADLTEDLDAIMGADLGAAQCLGELRTDLRIVQFALRSVEPTSELPSLMRISYAVFCLKTNTTIISPTSEISLIMIRWTPVLQLVTK